MAYRTGQSRYMTCTSLLNRRGPTLALSGGRGHPACRGTSSRWKGWASFGNLEPNLSPIRQVFDLERYIARDTDQFDERDRRQIAATVLAAE